MAKTAASDVWHKIIKDRGLHGVDFVARCADLGAAAQVGTGMMLHTVAGELTISAGAGTADQFDYEISVAEEIADDDRYFLAHKNGGKILHNQKLAGAYKLGDAVYESSTGTWTQADSDGVAGSKLVRLGFVCGPVDRITATVVKGIDDALTATEPADILV